MPQSITVRNARSSDKATQQSQCEGIGSCQSGKRKGPVSIQEAVAAGTLVVVNRDACLGKQAKITLKSSRAALTGVGEGTSSKRLSFDCWSSNQSDNLKKTCEFGKRIRGNISPGAAAARNICLVGNHDILTVTRKTVFPQNWGQFAVSRAENADGHI